MVGYNFYPELVRELYANTRKWENKNSEGAFNLGNIGVSSRVNGQEILIDESLLNELFKLSNRGCVVKTEKGVTDFYDDEGNKVAVVIDEIKKILLEKAIVVTVTTKLLDQNNH